MAKLPWNRIKPRRKRIGAIKAARKARSFGVESYTAAVIAYSAAILRVDQALAFALVEQESGFRHIFGCDSGPANKPPYCHQEVTRERFDKLREYAISTKRSNGVGLTQITYWTYLRDHPGIWRKLANVKLGLKLIRDAVANHGKREGLARYNGGPTPPESSYGYADSVLSLEKKWRRRFS